MTFRQISHVLQWIVLLVFTAVLTACTFGGGPARKNVASPAPATVEAEDPSATVARIRGMMGEAMKKYAAGETDAAYELAADAYLEGFEDLEEKLVERGQHEFVEDLELKFKALRDGVRAGKPQTELQSLVEEIEKGLDEALNILTSQE